MRLARVSRRGAGWDGVSAVAEGALSAAIPNSRSASWAKRTTGRGHIEPLSLVRRGEDRIGARLRVDPGVCTRPEPTARCPTAVRRRPPPGREHRLGRPARALADSRHVIGGRAPANWWSAPSRRLRSVAILRAPRKTSTAPYASRRRSRSEGGRMFPVDPNAPGGPERSEYVRRGYLDRAPLHERCRTPNVRRQERPRSAGYRRAA
jgi:hypothetical protein